MNIFKRAASNPTGVIQGLEKQGQVYHNHNRVSESHEKIINQVLGTL